ncbi:MAG: ferredoxin family protein [Actinobacteria bacterium]|jgi:NAD-dependent dihydropyrimidine dehydrogenase PreA subunit|nr:ferredoxin family protein [Actinomycetota bacterium]
MPPIINYDICDHCGICDRHCPTDVFYKGGDPPTVTVRYPDECWHCGVCRLDCPLEAISIVIPAIAIYA